MNKSNYKQYFPTFPAQYFRLNVLVGWVEGSETQPLWRGSWVIVTRPNLQYKLILPYNNKFIHKLGWVSVGVDNRSLID